MKTIRRTQDAGEKITIEFSEKDIPKIEMQIKSIMGWRKPTKKYKTIYERFCKSGTRDYDYIIKCLKRCI